MLLDTGRDVVQPSRLEELLEEGRGDGQHHLVGGDYAVLALDVNVNIPLEIGHGEVVVPRVLIRTLN